MGKNILFDQKGNSLVMVIVAAGLSSIISLVVADMMNQTMKTQNIANNMTDFELVAQDINIKTSTSKTCGAGGFAKDAQGNPVNIPAAIGPVNVDRLMRDANNEILRVGSKISSGTTVQSVQLLPSGLPDELNIPATVNNVPGTYTVRHMRLQVSLQRPADALGNRNPVKTFPVRLFFPAGGGPLATCEKVPEVADAGQANLTTATGKVDWVKSTVWKAGKGDAKYLGMTFWRCQSTSGTGQCSQFYNNGNSQYGITVKCSDGRAGFTVLRDSAQNGDKIDEQFTTYCAFDPNAIPITPPAPSAPVDPGLFVDGDVYAMCASNPSDPMCAGLIAYNQAVAACNVHMPDQQAYDNCVNNIPPPSQQASSGSGSSGSGSSGGGSTGTTLPYSGNPIVIGGGGGGGGGGGSGSGY